MINSDGEPPSDRDTPHLGSVVARLREADPLVPPFVTLPWLAMHPAAPGGRTGQNGGWLGSRYDPMLIAGDRDAARWCVDELSLADDITLARLDSRKSLLAAIDQQRQIAERAADAGLDTFKQKAIGL